MKSAHDIIIRPIITEKSMQALADKKYTFRVMKSAGKIEIAKAVEQLFGVKVVKVNTINVPGKFKRVGLKSGYKSDWKKAVITVSEDSKPIEFFESMM